MLERRWNTKMKKCKKKLFGLFFAVVIVLSNIIPTHIKAQHNAAFFGLEDVHVKMGEVTTKFLIKNKQQVLLLVMTVT